MQFEANQNGLSQSLYWVFPLAVIAYCSAGYITTSLLQPEGTAYPVVASYGRFVPRFIHNLVYLLRATQNSEYGYTKFRGKAFQLLRNEGTVLLLPLSLLEELSKLPEDVASPTLALERDLVGDFTGLNLIVENRLHHTIVLAGEVIVGPSFCTNQVWLDISFKYTENLFVTIAILRLFPQWMHPIIYNLDDINILHWLCGVAKGNDRRPNTISHVLVLVALASVHTTLFRMVNVLYDVTAAGQGLREEIIAEIASTAAEKWTGVPYDKLYRLDSVMRESQRLSPPTTLGMKRFFKKSYTFRDGTFIPAGTYACMPTYAIETDAKYTPNPDRFDGLRHFRILDQRQQAGDPDAAKELLFSTPAKTNLSFGFGKAACPRRLFASCVVKIVLVKLLTDYEFSFLPGTERPRDFKVYEFLFVAPRQTMLVRRKKEGTCPF
ncbi:cytochrome P450 [Hypoxylon trugodes]|uniref:cytochrome P450 n=1 Tax=Hypoxylon trugodes TaxID=326681 RepID=UPI0021980E42|nr:cytochrome P450 [Hypoxylon trugodes]KAI1393093.1 cytochrome P450 [Hypoxylon trugodes]